MEEIQEEITLETVKERIVGGVVTLTSQYFILYIIAFISQIFVLMFLGTAQYGTFGVLSAIKNFMSYFSDVGLAASLIQKKEKLTKEDVRTAFTVQQGLVILLLVILFLVMPIIKNSYHLGQDGVNLMYALGISLFLSSLKTIPSVLLERQLKFVRIAFVNIAEILLLNVFIIFFAARGYGITAYTFAFLISGTVGVILMYVMNPWKPGFHLSVPVLKHLLRFGAVYQINTFIALLKDDGLIIVLGKLIGLDAVGILTAAQGLSQQPLRIVMDSVTRVTFPAFARMQHDAKELANTLTRSIFFITFLVFPMLTGIAILAPDVIHAVPRLLHWAPALIALIYFCGQSMFSSFTTQITNFFTAIGKIRITSYLIIMWTVLTLFLVPILGIKFGVNGAAFGFFIVGASSLVALYLAKKEINFSINESILKPLYAVAGMGVLLLILRGLFSPSVYSIGVMIVVGGLFYFVLLLFLVGKSLIEDAKKSFNTLFHH